MKRRGQQDSELPELFHINDKMANPQKEWLFATKFPRFRVEPKC
jgi:hypothetical protein